MKQLVVGLVLAAALVGCARTTPPEPTVIPTEFPTLSLPTATPSPTAPATNQPITPTQETPGGARTAAPTQTAPVTSTAVNPPAAPTKNPTPTTAANDPVLVGAGDIAVCGAAGDEATAKLIESIPGTVFTAGDNAYPGGTARQFQDCYNPSWGKFKARTQPAPGNHEYQTQGAQGYFGYFGAAAGDPQRGYYSYNLGTWHIIVLNSQISMSANSPQVTWLKQDLAANPAKCVAAIWHRSLFSSGPHGRANDSTDTRPLWQALYAAGADVIISAHDHDYERFAPQDPQGNADPQRGIREFVVGTGGAAPYRIDQPAPNSEARRSGVPGVLKLTLRPDSYSWEFVPITGFLFRDAGVGQCH